MALDQFPMFLLSSHDVALLEIAVTPPEASGPSRPVVLTVSGEIDPLTIGSLHAALVGAVHEYRPERIALDLSGVTFVDSGGVRTLLSGLVTAQRAGCELVIAAASPVVLRTLDVCGVLDVFAAAVTR